MGNATRMSRRKRQMREGAPMRRSTLVPTGSELRTSGEVKVADAFTDEATTSELGTCTTVAPVMMYPRSAIDDIAVHEHERGYKRGASRGFLLGFLVMLWAWTVAWALSEVLS